MPSLLEIDVELLFAFGHVMLQAARRRHAIPQRDLRSCCLSLTWLRSTDKRHRRRALGADDLYRDLRSTDRHARHDIMSRWVDGPRGYLAFLADKADAPFGQGLSLVAHGPRDRARILENPATARQQEQPSGQRRRPEFPWHAS